MFEKEKVQNYIVMKYICIVDMVVVILFDSFQCMKYILGLIFKYFNLNLDNEFILNVL